MLLGLCSISFVHAQSENSYDAEVGGMSRNIIEFTNGSIDALYAQMDPQLQAQLTMDSLQVLYNNRIQGLGEASEILEIVQSTFLENDEQYRKLGYNIAFTEQNIWMRYIINDQGGITSFVIE